LSMAVNILHWQSQWHAAEKNSHRPGPSPKK
jgi:hypothetical protein